MFLEVPFSMLAWIGVIILQAIIHFGMLSRGVGSSSRNLRRLLGGHEPCWMIRQDCDDEEDEDDDTNKTNYDTQNLSKEDQWLFQSEDDDEFSENLEAHLSQTGDDIIKVNKPFSNH
jgi:hypothetical protein